MTTSNEAKITEMERTLRTAPEPGSVSYDAMGEEISMAKSSVTSAGYVTMWNTDTREPSIFNMNSVRAKLGEVFSNDYPENPSMRGKPCWTSEAPSTPPWRGIATCPLHDSRPERPAYDAMGYPKCSRIELPNEMDAQEHLRLKHPRTWTLMQTQRGEVERIAQEEDRVLNRKILEHLSGVAEPAVSIVSQSPVGSQTVGVSTVTYTDVPENEEFTFIEIPKHIHNFPKTMGAKCRKSDCDSVRTTEFKSRKKK